MHLTAAQQAGEREVWSNDRHVPAAAAYFGLLVGLSELPLEILGSHRNRPHRCVIGTDATQRVEDRTGIFLRRLANLRQVDWRRRGEPFAEASEPGGSRNGSTEMRS